MLIEELEFVKRKVDLGTFITPDIKALDDAFDKHGYDLRIVGGSVRDLVLNKKPKDVDLATDAMPDEMKLIFDLGGFKWFPTGEQHGTLTVLGPTSKEPFEITTLRIDTDHTGRHATVEFTRDWKQDAERRDLTYNAMSIDLKTGNLYDYYGGLEDLESGITKFVGSADSRIKEDFLRILRLFRFAARYGHPITSDTRKAIRDNAANLKNISGERIWMEVSKILSGPNTAQSLKTMKEVGVSDVIGLPVRELSELQDVKKRTSNPITLLVTQLRDGNEVDSLRNKWRFSNPERELALFLVDNKYKTLSQDDLHDMIVHGAKKEFVYELAKLLGLDDVSSWSEPTFPVKGADLLALGMKPGPDLGKALANLKSNWVNSRFSLSKDELLQSLRK